MRIGEHMLGRHLFHVVNGRAFAAIRDDGNGCRGIGGEWGATARRQIQNSWTMIKQVGGTSGSVSRLVFIPAIL